MKQENPVTELSHPSEEDLKAFCDGELPWLRRVAVRRHLASCAACREEVQAMQMLHKSLRETDGLEEPFAPALRERILAQVADIPPLPAPRRTPRAWQYGLVTSLAVNCLFLFLLGRNETLSHRATTPDLAPPPTASAPSASLAPSNPSAESHRARIMHSRAQPMQSRHDPFKPSVSNTPSNPAMRQRLPGAAPSMDGQPSADKQKSAPVTPVPRDTAPLQPQGSAGLAAPQPAVSEPDAGAFQAAKRVGEAAPPGTAADVMKPKALSSIPATGAAGETPPAPPAAIRPPAFAAPAPAPAPASPLATPPPVMFRGGAGGGAGGFGGPMAQDFALQGGQPTPMDPWPTHTVEADWQVDAQGNVSDIRFKTDERTALEDAIRDIIRQNRYRPATQNGKPITARMSHTFVINP